MIRFPNGAIILEEDNECKEFLVRIGAWADLNQRHPVLDCVSAVINLPQAWVAATWNYGHEDPADNGYLVIIFEKDKFTIQSANRFIREFLRAASLNPDGIHINVPPANEQLN